MGDLGDRRDFAQQADKVVAALLERQGTPLPRRGPAELLLDFVDKAFDALGGGPRLFLLHDDRGAFGLVIAEPHVESAVDHQDDADQTDKGERQFEREPHPQTPAGALAGNPGQLECDTASGEHETAAPVTR